MSIHNPDIAESLAETRHIVEAIEAIPEEARAVWNDKEAMNLYVNTAFDLVDQFDIPVEMALEILKNLYHAARQNNEKYGDD